MIEEVVTRGKWNLFRITILCTTCYGIKFRFDSLASGTEYHLNIRKKGGYKMDEFYDNYMQQILRKIFEAYKQGNKEAIKEYALELKELNKQIFLDKQLVK